MYAHTQIHVHFICRPNTGGLWTVRITVDLKSPPTIATISQIGAAPYTNISANQGSIQTAGLGLNVIGADYNYTRNGKSTPG